MKNDYDFLIVYNTCGIKRDNTEHYIKCLQTILDSKISYKYKLVVSSCLNSKNCRDRLRQAFGDLVEIVTIDKVVTVNISYNKTCINMISKYGPFKGYLYLDSGIDFENNENALERGFESFLKNKYGILSFQASNDHGLHNSKGATFPVTGKDYVMPLGGSVNGHAELFCHSIFETYGRLWPDVFSAFCTESTFSFLAASVGKRQAVLKDIILNHLKSVDGASSSSPHVSTTNGTPWNNLLCGRNANDFIHDDVAIKAGLGYEECGNIMIHNKDAYHNGLPKDPESLCRSIRKYFYLSSEDICYDS